MLLANVECVCRLRLQLTLNGTQTLYSHCPILAKRRRPGPQALANNLQQLRTGFPSVCEKHLTLHLSATAGCNAFGLHTFCCPNATTATIPHFPFALDHFHRRALGFGKRLSSARRINSQVCNLVCGQFWSVGRLVWTGRGSPGASVTC